MIRLTLRFAGIIFGAILIARMVAPDLAPIVLLASLILATERRA